MFRATIAGLLLAAGMFLPAAAEMSQAERDEFRAEVRSYLLENPEVLMEAIGVLEAREAAQAAVGDSQLVADNAAALFDDGVSYVGGNPDGDVTVVEFLDYRCGYCKRAHPEVAELLARDGDIRLIVKEFPILGEQSLLASRFAIATRNVAGDAAYSRMTDALMAMRGDVTEDSLLSLADEQELDGAAILLAMAEPEVEEVIAANRELAQRLKINGTPSFVFGDQMVRGYVPLDAMQQLVATVRKE